MIFKAASVALAALFAVTFIFSFAMVDKANQAAEKYFTQVLDLNGKVLKLEGENSALKAEISRLESLPPLTVVTTVYRTEYVYVPVIERPYYGTYFRSYMRNFHCWR